MLPLINPIAISVTNGGSVRIDAAELNQFVASKHGAVGTFATNASSCPGTNAAGCANDGCTGSNVGCVNAECHTTGPKPGG